MQRLPRETFDSVVSDPPYHLQSIVERFGGKNAAPAQFGTDGVYSRSSAGFMSQTWDGGDVAFRPETWAAVYDVMKPGAYLAAFGGTRTFHRMACAIEDGGFEIRDCIMWLYGSGFPKSHNVGKMIDKKAGATPETAHWGGYGTALKPAWEPIIIARKPIIGTIFKNVLRYGTGGMHIEACRVEATDKTPAPVGQYVGSRIGPDGHSGIRDGQSDHLGRWPANVMHDGSDEVLAAFAQYGPRGALLPVRGSEDSATGDNGIYNHYDRMPGVFHGDSGTAARFFYAAKASKADRAGSKHPTIKPVSLMRYITRLVTPAGGLTLDPFAGSGATGAAAIAEGFNAVLIEREGQYIVDIVRRLNGKPVVA
jgi:site-specific DNA-methyltransferase (adenine-specific)